MMGEQAVRQAIASENMIRREFVSDYGKPDFLVCEQVYIDSKVYTKNITISSYAYRRYTVEYTPTVVVFHHYKNGELIKGMWCEAKKLILKEPRDDYVEHYNMKWWQLAPGRTPFAYISDASPFCDFTNRSLHEIVNIRK
tara:strand:- start:56 stop:475 length:420 start_codon:yes stop_codon:yes gene_type:complete